MNNIDTKTINRSIKGQGLVFVFCALFCLIGLLCIPGVKVFAGDEGSGYGNIADAVYDWAAFVPDADKISTNPSLLAYCLANGLDDFDEIFISNQTSYDSDSDTVDRSNGRFVGRKSCILKCTNAAVAWGRHLSVISYVRDRRIKILIQISVFYIDLDKQFIVGLLFRALGGAGLLISVFVYL